MPLIERFSTWIASYFRGNSRTSGSADIPATPGRADVTDADRVYPGDGLAPWEQIVATLKSIGYEGMLSLELFNRGYWEQDPVDVARLGIAKIRRLIEEVGRRPVERDTLYREVERLGDTWAVKA